MSEYKLGYTQGVYDMFHIGHLNLLNHAKMHCERLIVGVNSDRLVESYKNKTPVINQEDRLEILKNIKAVDDAFLVDTLDKMILQEKLKFDVVFIGDDWKNNPRWVSTREALAERGVDVVFLPYTSNISSTILRDKETKAIHD